MVYSEPIAHITEDGKCQTLRDHSLGTATKAAKMASSFGSAQWGYLAGLWHDLGKSSYEFQSYIRSVGGIDAHIEGKHGRVDHSTAGALYAIREFNVVGRILAYTIAGHHAGLPDWEADKIGRASLKLRLKNKELLISALENGLPSDMKNRSLPSERPLGVACALWIRLLFSCLVDSDFLDTETFLKPDKAVTRGSYQNLSIMLTLFTDYMKKKQDGALNTKVNRVRANILARCIAKASSPPGIYTLTVPTGGGKTLSSMAFALHHAVINNKERIIYVIPYTSIIEQTADQFRQIFGESVIEHHSNLDVSDETKDNARTRLASENWDAPIIVTTTVQFFESLFASRPSRCRKLHNIVNSVVILDEVQLLPPQYLKPILHVLRELQKNFGVTLLLSSATQPALGPQQGPNFKFEGLPNMEEIVENPSGIYNQLKRVEIHIPHNLDEPKSWVDLASELSQHTSVLCIVNRRDDCRTLWEMMPEGTFHLSALMCGEHRSARISEIKQRLKDGKSTRVVSTQLVEAGVDVDFPVVYRALAGLDSLAQASGRCNREGLWDKGSVVVFVPPSKIPAGYLRQAAEIGRRHLSEDSGDVLSPDRFRRFFEEFYWLQGERLDRQKILNDLRMSRDFRCGFRSAAMKFHLIDESQQGSVIVGYRGGSDLIEQLKHIGPERWLMRKLQRYVVNLPIHLHKKLLIEGAILEVHPGIYVQGHGALYRDDIGFCPDKSIIHDPDDLIV